MSVSDSFDKVVMTYFAGVTAQPFTYKGREYLPKPLHVSAAFFHDYSCKLACAGCCPRFSLDYLPHEARPDYPHQQRMVVFDGRVIPLISKLQKPQADRRFCDNVNLETGACMVHGKQPFSCDFETLRFTHYADHAWLGTRPYGRGWNMMRVDGKRGALCEFPKEVTEHSREEGIRKLKRLKEWTDHAGLHTYLPSIIRWAATRPTQGTVFERFGGFVINRKTK